MPRPHTPLPKNTEQHMRTLLRTRAKTARDLQRIQCILFRVAEHYTSEKTATMIGLSASSVKRIWSAYLQDGDTALLGENRGKVRGHAYLSLQQEEAFLKPFLQRAMKGELITVRDIHTALQKKLGSNVHAVTTYRLLARHHWRKAVPKPRHPNADVDAQEAFKASFPPDRTAGTARSEGTWTCVQVDV
jgi:transposase